MKRNTKRPETMSELTEALLAAVALSYPNDPSKAGVVMARLGPGDFYASLCRYTEPYGRGKVVLCKARGVTAEASVRELARVWRSGPADAASALVNLDRILGKG